MNDKVLAVILALLGAVATSLTSIFAKVGIKDVDSNFATFFRTLIVVFCALIMCLVTNTLSMITKLDLSNYIFLIFSGAFTGLSWIFYYKAIKIGDVNKVVPIDKSSFILTNLLFMIFFFNITTNNGDILTILMLFLSMFLMLLGTILMVGRKEVNGGGGKYLVYAILSSIFASLVPVFVKIGLNGVSV